MNESINPRINFTGRELLRIALFALVLTLAFLTPIRNMDIWWHLDSGRWMLDHFQYLGTEIRSYTIHGAEWHNFSWLFQVVVALAERLGGGWGLLILKSLLCWLIFLFLIMAMGRRVTLIAGLIVFTMLSWPLVTPMFLRPHLFEGVFLSIVVWLAQSEPRRKDILWFVPLILLWANAHGSVVIGVAALGLHYVLGPNFSRPSREELRYRLPRLLLLAALIFATPNGLDLVSVFFDHASSDSIRTYIQEWAPLMHWPVSVLILLTGVLIASFWRRGIVTPAEMLLIITYTVLATGSKRFFFELAVVLVRPSAVILSMLLKEVGQRSPLFAGSNGWVPGALILVGAILVQNPLEIHKLYFKSDYPVAWRQTPHVVMSVLEPVIEGEKTLKVWNAYGWGGYIGWASKGKAQVYIDGRTPTVFPQEMLVINHFASLHPKMLHRQLSKWKIDAIILHSTRRPPISPYDPNWKLVAYDGTSIGYLRADIAQRYGLDKILLDPFRPVKSVPTRQLPSFVAQTRWLISRDTDNAMAWLNLAEYLGRLYEAEPTTKLASETAAALQQAIRLDPSMLQARIELANWLLDRGRPAEEATDPLLPYIWKMEDKDRMGYQVNLARTLLRAKQPEAVIKILESQQPLSQKRLDEKFDVWLLRLEAYLILGEKDKAKQKNKVVAAMVPDATPASLAHYRELLERYPYIAFPATSSEER